LHHWRELYEKMRSVDTQVHNFAIFTCYSQFIIHNVLLSIAVPFEVLKVWSSGRQCRADRGDDQRYRRERQQNLKEINGKFNIIYHYNNVHHMVIYRKYYNVCARSVIHRLKLSRRGAGR